MKHPHAEHALIDGVGSIKPRAKPSHYPFRRSSTNTVTTNLTGSVPLVTGATSGIANATALLAQPSAHVLMGDRLAS